MYYAEKFDREKCTLCGKCFEECPVMALDSAKAKKEIARLINGEMTEEVLQRCTSCHSCNIICPENANPMGLILERWHEAFNKEGMPARALYFTAHADPNFRTYAQERLPADEKALLAKWDDDSPCEEIMYPGCNVLTVPYLTMSKIFEGVEIRGSLDLCCGEMYYRTGHFDQLKMVARKLTDHFRKMGVKKMLIPCTAGWNLFTTILPRFGADFGFTVGHVLPWIYERIKSGELKVVKPLNMSVTIHDSCHAKAFGPGYMDLPRKLLEALGATVREQEYIKENKLCCGIGGGFSHYSSYNPLKITLATYRALASSHKPKADAIAVYCAGCLQQLSVGQFMHPLRNIPIYHLIELVQMAIGEKPERRIRGHAFTMLTGVAIKQFPKTLSWRRYRMPGLESIEPVKK
ncbi:MAG TPA: (Fe-S)-binding protein [Spirochaetes bacterium]|nr:(Fe-S)-binding protein [Spirochaetota bacterium]